MSGDFSPPMIASHGKAPAAECSRWLDGFPCGAAGTHHVIWDMEMRNGCVCAEHAAEARRRWVYAGLHPYTAACAAAGHGGVWVEREDRCVLEGDLLLEQFRAGEEAAADLSTHLGIPSSRLR